MKTLLVLRKSVDVVVSDAKPINSTSIDLGQIFIRFCCM